MVVDKATYKLKSSIKLGLRPPSAPPVQTTSQSDYVPSQRAPQRVKASTTASKTNIRLGNSKSTIFQPWPCTRTKQRERLHREAIAVHGEHAGRQPAIITSGTDNVCLGSVADDSLPRSTSQAAFYNATEMSRQVKMNRSRSAASLRRRPQKGASNAILGASTRGGGGGASNIATSAAAWTTTMRDEYESPETAAATTTTAAAAADDDDAETRKPFQPHRHKTNTCRHPFGANRPIQMRRTPSEQTGLKLGCDSGIDDSGGWTTNVRSSYPLMRMPPIQKLRTFTKVCGEPSQLDVSNPTHLFGDDEPGRWANLKTENQEQFLRGNQEDEARNRQELRDMKEVSLRKSHYTNFTLGEENGDWQTTASESFHPNTRRLRRSVSSKVVGKSSFQLGRSNADFLTTNRASYEEPTSKQQFSMARRRSGSTNLFHNAMSTLSDSRSYDKNTQWLTSSSSEFSDPFRKLKKAGGDRTAALSHKFTPVQAWKFGEYGPRVKISSTTRSDYDQKALPRTKHALRTDGYESHFVFGDSDDFGVSCTRSSYMQGPTRSYNGAGRR